jgi:hypothetical protein
MRARDLGLVAVLGCGLLAACATPAPPPPALAFAGQGCAAAPDLSKAVSLTPEKPKAEFVVGRTIDASADCLRGPQGARPYVVFALPADPTGKTVTAGGLLEGARIFSPDVALLDEAGQATRTFRPADFYYRGAVFSVQFQPKAGERYLLVSAEPSRVGQRYDAIAIGTQTNSVYAAGAMITWTRGLDTKTSRTFSYAGQVQVTVDTAKPPVPKTGA